MKVFGERHPRLAWLPVVSGLLLAAGCGDTGGRVPVGGTVTVDGKPVAHGSVTFIPAEDTKANSAGATIEDGRFDMPAGKGLKPGEYLVSVSVYKITGRQVPHPISGEMEPEQIVINFGREAGLRATVATDGENQFDFTLESKGN